MFLFNICWIRHLLCCFAIEASINGEQKKTFKLCKETPETSTQNEMTKI